MRNLEASLATIYSRTDQLCLNRPYHFKFLKGCLPQILLGQILNTLSQSHFIKRVVHRKIISINSGTFAAVLNLHLDLEPIICCKVVKFHIAGSSRRTIRSYLNIYQERFEGNETNIKGYQETFISGIMLEIFAAENLGTKNRPGSHNAYPRLMQYLRYILRRL